MYFKNWHVAIFLVISAFFFRFFNLEINGLWLDEIHSAIGAAPDKTINEVLEYCKKDQPPFFFLMLHYWYKGFGYNDFTGRFFVILTGLIGIVAVYFLGKECKNESVGLFASFLSAVNYFHIDFSREVRFYPLVFLLTAFSYLFFLRVFKKGTTMNYFLYFLSTSLLLNTHYFGMVVFASQMIIFFVVLALFRNHSLSFVCKSIFTGILVGLSFLHWIPNVLSDLNIETFHAQPVVWYFPVSFYWVYFRDIVTCLVTASLLIVALRKIFFTGKQKSDSLVKMILLGWILLGMLIPLTYSLVRMPMLEYKYTIIILPSLFVLIAIGFDAISKQLIRVLIILVLTGSFLVNAFFVQTIYFRQSVEHWREAARLIADAKMENEVVFTDYAWYLRYYFTVYKIPSQPLEQRYADFSAHIKQSKNVWVIRNMRYPDQGLSVDQQNLIDGCFKLREEINYPDLNIKLYSRY